MCGGDWQSAAAHPGVCENVLAMILWCPTALWASWELKEVAEMASCRASWVWPLGVGVLHHRLFFLHKMWKKGEHLALPR